MFVNRNSAAAQLTEFPSLFTPCSPLFKVRQHPQCEQSTCNSVGLKMQLSSVVASSKLLLQLCISTLHCLLASVFSKVASWTAGACKGTTSPVSPVDGKLDPKKVRNATSPTSVNYHFTRKCNYKCGFCFHTAKTSFVLPLEEAKRGLKLLKDSGKFLYPGVCVGGGVKPLACS